MPRLVITVDTEVSNFPSGMGIWGRINNEDWGLTRMIREFDSAGICGTFFLDPYGSDVASTDQQKRAAELIMNSGHDLQLHTHPGPAFDHSRDQLKHYSLEEQHAVIAFGVDRLEAWTGRRPVLHRAGDWAANHDSLTVLKERGFRADFSSSPWSPNCGIERRQILGNGWKRIEGLLCGVGTCYRDRLTGRLRRVDLGGVSFREAIEVMCDRPDPYFLTLHSFSLLKYNDARTRFAADPAYIKCLVDFCKIAQSHGYETCSALAAVTAVEQCSSLPWVPLSTTGALASASGILKSVRGRLSTLHH